MLQKLLGISYRDLITNDAVRDRIRQAIGPCDDILTTVKKRKLKWYGHVSRSSGLAKTILQGTEQGGRRRVRQKKRWENNISEWTGLKFCNALREVEDKIKWRKREMWCKLRLNQGQRWQILHLPTNLQRHVNWYANVVFTTPLISSSFTLFCTLFAPSKFV